MYKDTPQWRLLRYRHYSREYGTLVSAGEYQINEPVRFDNGQAKGSVAWKYQDQNGCLVYIIEDYSGFPFKITAQEIISRV